MCMPYSTNAQKQNTKKKKKIWQEKEVLEQKP